MKKSGLVACNKSASSSGLVDLNGLNLSLFYRELKIGRKQE